MQSPLRSERDAFRMVLAAVAYFGLIAIGWKIERWLGVAVFVGLTGGGLVWLRRARRRGAAARPARPLNRVGELRVVVVAEEGVAVPALVDALRARAAGRRVVVQVVAPAGGDLADRLLELRAAGLDATGETAEGDPLPAVEEAVQRFEADEIVVAAPAEAGGSPWPGPGFVDRARLRFDLPVLGLAADPDGPA